jgi:hypothetical protein
MTFDYIWGALIAAFVALVTIICLPHSALAAETDEQTCSVFKEGELENKAEYKRCLARLASGDEAYRDFLICVGREGHKATEQGECGPAPPLKPQPAAFRPWQRAWQCNDIRVTETVVRQGIVSYDLGGTIWGGSQFALDIRRGTLWFNGKACMFLGGTP